MELATLQLLKYGAATETVSVEHYPGGNKCYIFPVLSIFFNDDFSPDLDTFGTSNCCIDITYKMSLGFPYMQCKIVIEKDDGSVIAELEDISIPLDPKKQNNYQRKIVALINACSKRVIQQEMNKNRIAMAAVAYSTLHNNLYN